MNLAEALRLGSHPSVVFVGAGGKTTALFQLARQLLAENTRHTAHATVLVSATTHLAVQQLALADHCLIVHTEQDIHALGDNWPVGVVLCIGPEHEAERMAGLPMNLMHRLHNLAQAHNCPLLLEGDGSRRRPLKAPAAHEPVIPDWIETVVVVAGLSGLGKPLSIDFVHRPEIFSKLSNLALGEIITLEKLAAVLVHPQGGIKSIPDTARRVVLLNQADDPQRQSSAQRLAEQLVGHYQAALVAALDPQQPSSEKSGILAVYEQTAGIILAAGGSSRLGQPKQLLPWRGEALVRHVARAALQAGLSPVVVVTGHAAQDVQAAVQDLPVMAINNPVWQTGQSSSVKAGLAAIPEECGAAIFLLADQPQVAVGLIRNLVEMHTQSLAPLVAPLVDGQRSNPVLFDRRTFKDLKSLSGDTGGRTLFARYPVTWLPWHDPTQALDVDTEEDYARLLELGGNTG